MEYPVPYEDFKREYLKIPGVDPTCCRADYESLLRKHSPDSTGIIMDEAIIACGRVIKSMPDLVTT